MSLHINRFIDKVRACENRRQKDVTLSIQEARDLHSDITKMLLALDQLRSASPQETTITLEVKGDDF